MWVLSAASEKYNGVIRLGFQHMLLSLDGLKPKERAELLNSNVDTIRVGRSRARKVYKSDPILQKALSVRAAPAR